MLYNHPSISCQSKLLFLQVNQRQLAIKGKGLTQIHTNVCEHLRVLNALRDLRFSKTAVNIHLAELLAVY